MMNKKEAAEQTLRHSVKTKDMKESDRIIFFDTSMLTKTDGIEKRCNPAFLQAELEKVFPNEKLTVKTAEINTTGKYINHSRGSVGALLPVNRVHGLPAFCHVVIEHSTGKFTEKIFIWSPLKWNDRFIGCPGGGTAAGGESYINPPKNTSRCQTLPFAIHNGFTGATTDAGCTKIQWALNKDGTLNKELVENWRARSTHFMTVLGKATAQILHARPVTFSYLHGGSGGGRQSLVEAQEFPDDYNGIWASCPAINWSRFLPIGMWANAVMNSNNHIIKPSKLKFALEQAQETVGGKEKYYEYEEFLDFDYNWLIGKKVNNSTFTELDAKVLTEIYNGPHMNGQRLWYFARPGVLCWSVGVPIGAFWYTPVLHRPKPFFLSTLYCRWVTKNPKQKFDKITKEEFFELYNKSITEFADCIADNADLSSFKNAGGKLMLDHGLDDPLIPADGTADYYKRVCDTLGGKEAVDGFFKLFLTPGDGHGCCDWHNGGITECDGMKALIDWVENGKEPLKIRKVHVNKKGETIKEGIQTAR